MASSSPVVLILGAGPRVGTGVARAFAAKGYKVALTSRKVPEQNKDNHFHVKADLSDPESVGAVFEQVTKTVGAPSVVVYNAAAATLNPPEDPLALSVKDLERDLRVNTLSVLTAAHEAVKAFATLPSSASQTFIYTGNRQNIGIMPPLVGLGVGKAASAHIIQAAFEAYKAKGYKFYYADQRKPDGSAAGQIDGEAHGEFYVQLAGTETQTTWHATFVKGKGAVDFGEKVGVGM